MSSFVRQPPRDPPSLAKSGVDERLARLFERNIQTIALLNRARGVRQVFVGQVLNFEVMTPDRPKTWMPLASERDTKAIMTNFNRLLGEAADLGTLHLWPAVGMNIVEPRLPHDADQAFGNCRRQCFEAAFRTVRREGPAGDESHPHGGPSGLCTCAGDAAVDIYPP